MLTHAGVSVEISNGCIGLDKLVDDFNYRALHGAIDTPESKTDNQRSIADFFLSKPLWIRDPLFYVSKHRGGKDNYSGIFWNDPYCDGNIDPNFRQVFGHCEINTEPILNEFGHININHYGRDVCYLFDTSLNEVVKIDISPMDVKSLKKLYDKQVTRRMSGNYYHPE